MSKMGISVLSAYRGGCNFEAVGLSRAVVAEYFPGMISRISGIGIFGIETKVKELHKKAFQKNVSYQKRPNDAWESNKVWSKNEKNCISLPKS